MKLNPTQKAELQSLQAQLNLNKGGRYQDDKVKHQLDDLIKRFNRENQEVQQKKDAARAKHLKRFARKAKV